MMTFDNAYFRKAVGIRYSNLFCDNTFGYKFDSVKFVFNISLEEVGSAEIESSITKIGTKSNSGFGGGHRQKTADNTTDTSATN